jgi:hypothetical protein
MSIRFKVYIFSLFFALHINISAALSDYIYPNQTPSFSNYGTLGLMQNPSARFHEEGTLAFSYTVMQPYLRGSIVAYPFNWMEASYQYTDINNQLYSSSFAFSGNQTFKDKGFDVKFRILRESKVLPQIALASETLLELVYFLLNIWWGLKFLMTFLCHSVKIKF